MLLETIIRNVNMGLRHEEFPLGMDVSLVGVGDVASVEESVAFVDIGGQVS